MRPLALSSLFLLACGAGVPPRTNPTDPAGNFYQVTDGLYRGGRPDQAGVQRLAEMGVHTILDLEDDDQAIAAERAWAVANGLTFISSPMNGLARPDDRQVEIILGHVANPADRPMYVHCTKGQDRTGVIIALYRVRSEGWTPKDAYDEMEAHGYNNLLIAMKEYFEDKTHFKD
jgi:protein tyrosine/serine phosphatase